MSKRTNPYTALKETLQEYAFKVENRRTKTMWLYPKARLNDRWTLADLAERVAAAEQLGWDVVLVSDETGLIVKYREKPPTRPWEAR